MDNVAPASIVATCRCFGPVNPLGGSLAHSVIGFGEYGYSGTDTEYRYGGSVMDVSVLCLNKSMALPSIPSVRRDPAYRKKKKKKKKKRG